MRLALSAKKTLLIATLVAFLLVSGCGKKGAAPTVSSAWPRADSEKVVPKPPTPPRWPMTGLLAPNAALIHRRVLSVKVENSPAARPQTALNQADIVYESLAEGGITRFNALFQSKEPPIIGPVRSARLSDTWIVPQYNALFFFAGASSFVTRALQKVGIALLSEEQGVNRPYFRTSRPAPHNEYLKTSVGRAEARRRGYPTTQTLRPFAFDFRPIETTLTVSRIDIPFSFAQRTTWSYDRSAKVYLRQNNGVRHIDAATGEQVRAKNVVVLWAKMRSTGHPDKNGSPTFDIVLGGRNRAAVFHDGGQWNGVWIADRKSPPVFRADNGKLIRLTTGNSWFEVIPTNLNISLK